MAFSAPSPSAGPPRRFATTRWSLVLQARRNDEEPARAALEELCEAYWLPVYAFMRRQSNDLNDAQDLTQGFFLSLLARDALSDVSPSRGRFRSFLLAAAKHFVCNVRDRNRAGVRGGGVILHSLDYAYGERQLSLESSRELTAEGVFERRWALTMLAQVLNRLRREYDAAGRGLLFESLARHLSGEGSEESLAETAMRLQMTPEAVRTALHRLKKKYRHTLRNEIAQTTDSPDDVDDEIRQLFRALTD